MNYFILPECYVDTNLIESICPPEKQGGLLGYNHQKGCGTVTSKMQGELADSFALGIIDRDKKDVDYLKEFNEIIKTDGLILHRHKTATKHHYIIQIQPAVERFILNSAAEVDVLLSDYGLPITLDSLRKVSKSVNSKNDFKFKSLFKVLKNQNATNILKLAAWVDYLKANSYQADIDIMKTL